MKIRSILKAFLLDERGEVGFDVGGGEAPAPGAAAAFVTEGDKAGGEAPASSDLKIAYPEGLDESLLGNATIGKFANDKGELNYANVLKSLVHLQTNFGHNKVTVPHKDFTDTDYNTFYDTLGRPAPEDYVTQVANNVPEGMEANDALFKGFLGEAHKAGIMPKQAQAILDYFNGQMETEMKTTGENSKMEYNMQLDSLKKEWGSGFDKKKAYADAALKQFVGEEDHQALMDSGVLKDLRLLKVFSKIGEGLTEDVFSNTISGSYGITKEDAQERLSAMYHKDHPFMNKLHPGNQAAQNEFLRLQEVLHGTN